MMFFGEQDLFQQNRMGLQALGSWLVLPRDFDIPESQTKNNMQSSPTQNLGFSKVERCSARHSTLSSTCSHWNRDCVCGGSASKGERVQEGRKGIGRVEDKQGRGNRRLFKVWVMRNFAKPTKLVGAVPNPGSGRVQPRGRRGERGGGEGGKWGMSSCRVAQENPLTIGHGSRRSRRGTSG
jgi:hypothetical protein